jgi:hypothetical protein
MHVESVKYGYNIKTAFLQAYIQSHPRVDPSGLLILASFLLFALALILSSWTHQLCLPKVD